MKRVRLNRKKGLKPGRTKFRLSRLKGGKKTRENAKLVREKKLEHLKSGIVSCELRLSPYCTPFDNLTFAHSLKRREMGKVGTTEREQNMRECVLGCTYCHRILDEEMGHAEMKRTVKGVIAKRQTALPEAA